MNKKEKERRKKEDKEERMGKVKKEGPRYRKVRNDKRET